MPDGSTARGCDARYTAPGKDAACPPFTPATYVSPVPCAVSVVPPPADVVVPSKGNESISPAVETTVGATLVLAVEERLRDTVLVVVAAAVLAGVPDAVPVTVERAVVVALAVDADDRLRETVLEVEAAAELVAVPDAVREAVTLDVGVVLVVDTDVRLRETVFVLVPAAVSVGVADPVGLFDFVGATARAATSAAESARLYINKLSIMPL